MQITTSRSKAFRRFYCNRLSPKCKSQRYQERHAEYRYCNRLSPKCKSQPSRPSLGLGFIVTDYRLNANHNEQHNPHARNLIVTDYRLNANHN